MAARMTGEQVEKLSVSYLNTMSTLYDEIKKMEKAFGGGDGTRIRDFYSELIDGRKEVYNSAKKMYEAEPSKDNELRLRWSGAMCAMVETGKLCRDRRLTREEMLNALKNEFKMDENTASGALEAATYTGVVSEYEGGYRLR